MPSKRGTSQPRASKAVLERQTTCHHLLAELDALAPPGAVSTGIPANLLQGLAPWLHRSIGELVAQDEKVFTTRARLLQVRQDRDTALRTLAHDVAKLRLSIEGQYKAPQIRRLGFETPTPRSPEPLLRVASRVVKNLALPDIAERLGRPWYEYPFDPRTQQEPLARQVENLQQLLHQVDTLVRDLDLARIRRQQAQREHDTLAREARQMVESAERLSRLAESPARDQPQTETRAGRRPSEESLAAMERATEVARYSGMSLAGHTPNQPCEPPATSPPEPPRAPSRREPPPPKSPPAHPLEAPATRQLRRRATTARAPRGPQPHPSATNPHPLRPPRPPGGEGWGEGVIGQGPPWGP